MADYPVRPFFLSIHVRRDLLTASDCVALSHEIECCLEGEHRVVFLEMDENIKIMASAVGTLAVAEMKAEKCQKRIIIISRNESLRELLETVGLSGRLWIFPDVDTFFASEIKSPVSRKSIRVCPFSHVPPPHLIAIKR